MRRASATAVVGVVASLAVTAALWHYVGSPVFFLFVPFVPFLLGGGTDGPPRRRCSECGFTTTDPEFAYCPRDGTGLVDDADDTDDAAPSGSEERSA